MVLPIPSRPFRFKGDVCEYEARPDGTLWFRYYDLRQDVWRKSWVKLGFIYPRGELGNSFVNDYLNASRTYTKPPHPVDAF